VRLAQWLGHQARCVALSVAFSDIAHVKLTVSPAAVKDMIVMSRRDRNDIAAWLKAGQ
jgi:hypothetical protein